MQVANFRDDVVYPIADKMGLDPMIDLQSDEATAYVSYINAWVRRLYPNFDWPEWTLIEQRTPSASHYVDFAQANQKVIGRVLKVYLADPSGSLGAYDVPFRLNANGIHVGFEHGPTVWIKYIEAAPQFTSTVWLTGSTYNKGQLVYSPISGQCYRSKINGNKGHDPSASGGPVPAEITQEATLDQPGLPAKAKQMLVECNEILGGSDVPDPPPNFSIFSVMVDATVASHTATGTQAIGQIVTDLISQLQAAPALLGFTIAMDVSGQGITIAHASDFAVTASYSQSSIVAVPLVVKQIQAYVPATPPVAGQPQIAKVTIDDSLVARDTDFNLTFIDALGDEHTVTYTADVNDASEQVLAGLAAAISTAGATDPVLAAVQTSIDLPNKTLVITTPKRAGISAEAVPEASNYWDSILFPLELVDLVVRGGYADALREDGQTDKANAEEQLVYAEVKAKQSAIIPGPYNPMTDQARPAPRYHVPGAVSAGGGG